MPHFSQTMEISRPPDAVWRVLAQPEQWFEGYLETKNRSPEYPAPDSRNDASGRFESSNVYLSRRKRRLADRRNGSPKLTAEK